MSKSKMKTMIGSTRVKGSNFKSVAVAVPVVILLSSILLSKNAARPVKNVDMAAKKYMQASPPCI